MKDRIKKFCKDHENAIIVGGIAVAGITGTFVASYTSTRRGLDQLRIERVDLDKSKERVRITYKNGDQDYYHANL
jgi:hypothetical protein